MRASVFIVAAISAAAAPCAGASFTMGDASGSPGETVSLSVGISPSMMVTGFEFDVNYDSGALSFEGFSLSGGAKGNGINDVNDGSPYEGRASVEAVASNPSSADSISSLGSLKFKISNSATPGSSAEVSFTGSGRVRIGISSWSAASTSGSGSVTIQAPPTPPPTGPPPQVDVSMASPRELTYGQEPLLRFELKINDPSWEGVPADAYLAVNIPGNVLYYIDGKLRFSTSRKPISREMPIEKMDGNIGFGPLSASLPYGRYTFYCVLTWPGMDPRKNSSRITNLADTFFDLVPAPAPTPSP